MFQVLLAVNKEYQKRTEEVTDQMQVTTKSEPNQTLEVETTRQDA